MKVGRPKRRFDSAMLLDLCVKKYSVRGMAKLFACSPITIKKAIREIPEGLKEKGYTQEAIDKDVMPVIMVYLN